jgi:hypothetical protein
LPDGLGSGDQLGLHLFGRWQIIQAGDLAVITHTGITLHALTARAVDHESAMRLEGRDPRQIFPADRKMRHAPFDGLAKVGHGLMHQRAQMGQDRAGERCRFLDIGIDLRLLSITLSPQTATGAASLP